MRDGRRGKCNMRGSDQDEEPFRFSSGSLDKPSDPIVPCGATGPFCYSHRAQRHADQIKCECDWLLIYSACVPPLHTESDKLAPARIHAV